MEAVAFQVNKVRRAIQTQGSSFVVTSPVLNAYGEPSSWTVFKTIRGLYHETTGFISKTVKDGSSINRKSSPMILCLASEVSGLKKGMKVLHGSKEFALVEVKDLGEAGAIFDLSLEEIQHGE